MAAVLVGAAHRNNHITNAVRGTVESTTGIKVGAHSHELKVRVKRRPSEVPSNRAEVAVAASSQHVAEAVTEIANRAPNHRPVFDIEVHELVGRAGDRTRGHAARVVGPGDLHLDGGAAGQGDARLVVGWVLLVGGERGARRAVGVDEDHGAVGLAAEGPGLLVAGGGGWGVGLADVDRVWVGGVESDHVALGEGAAFCSDKVRNWMNAGGGGRGWLTRRS